MNRNKILIISGIVLLLLAVVMALDSNLSELAPVFLVLGMACFGWLIYQKTWHPSTEVGPTQPTTLLAKISSLLGIAGVLCIGLCGLSFLDSSLEEFAVAGILGVALLIFALLVRIVNGMYTKRVDAATGGLSIVAILALVASLVILCFLIYMVYLALNW